MVRAFCKPSLQPLDTLQTPNWHERAAFQRSSFGRSRSGCRLLAMTQWPLKTPFFSLFFFFFFFLFSFPVVYFSHRRSARIKKLIQRKLTGVPQNLWVNPFPDRVGHFGPPGGHIGFCRRYGVAGSERVPSLLLCCYYFQSMVFYPIVQHLLKIKISNITPMVVVLNFFEVIFTFLYPKRQF